jgi:hypothetical protein
LLDEPVAEADNRFDLVGGGAKLPSQASDMHVYRARFHDVLVPPDALEQPVA